MDPTGADWMHQVLTIQGEDLRKLQQDVDSFVDHVSWLTDQLLENCLFVKPEKCGFHLNTVAFLGFIISHNQVKPNPAKVKAITGWPVPSSVKQLQQFFGFANFYRRFIHGFSQVAAPLTALTSSKTTFQWTPQADSTFTQLKTRFATSPILTQPDPAHQHRLPSV
ncbi:uncharacterized mitochondrial protein AtMg00860-like [Thalassophryne amazonica]|uniref:uncharacterized mitochondrial protein AtMg00860-like n=1 Tax=Thalassophryne amazonica TaxID=390379 RepID=UPI0014716C66|nr:uncharacterized mitochondrial protein AtMg00860-like [Thalassophryne amazonica]